MPKDLTKEAMKIVYKGYTDLTQTMIEHVFSNQTENSYCITMTRWYVSKYNEGHYIHYRFKYTKSTVTMLFRILPYPDKPDGQILSMMAKDLQ